MKKLLLVSLLALTLTGCEEAKVEIPAVEHTASIVSGRYYTNGELITSDGNIWGYSQDIISEEPAYDNEPVYAVIDDNGTPNIIEDDIIAGLVLDRETAIYDALETAFSDAEGFTVEREGNTIKIGTDN